MKRFWLLALLMAGTMTAALSTPTIARSDEGTDASADQSQAIDDINSALGSMASKINDMEGELGSGLKIFGDVRGRYAVWSQTQSDKSVAPSTISDKAVGRYRARVGVKDSFGDLTGGLRIATGGASNPNSQNNTYDNGFADPSVNIDLAFLTYTPGWLDKVAKITVGKMGNPLEFTPISWDPDINPEGAALELSKDDTKLVAAYFDLVNTAGKTQTATNSGTATDEFMLNFQLEQLLKLTDDSSLKAMVGFEDIPYANALAQGAAGQPAGYVGPVTPIGTSNTPLNAGNILNANGYLPAFQVGEAMLQLKNKFGDVPMQWTVHAIDNFNSFNVPKNETLAGPSSNAGYTNLSNQLGLYVEAKAGDTKKGHFLGCLAYSRVEPNAQLANLASDDANFTNTAYVFEQLGYGLEKNVSLLLSVWEMQRLYYAYMPTSVNNNMITQTNGTTPTGTTRNPLVQVYADCVLNF